MVGSSRVSLRGTGDGHVEGPGAFVNTGHIDGNVVLPPVRPAVSGYLHQVRRLAAPRFQGREEELASMVEFCTAPRATLSGAWWRWLAPAWAGKTALMAQFVLNPPTEIVVVSFFITARLAGQNNRAAFCEVVQRQLYALLDEEEPAVTEYTRDESLLHALDRAARHCADRGRRLVLVVDGLDEDHSNDAAVGGHSIAALLPANPPHGIRILVAGRPHPPIPHDVPTGHPLRTDAINHRLTRSPHAATVRAEAENALDELVEKGGLGYQLLGLVAAAGGGLSAEDLAHLLGTRPLRIRRTLAGVTGRLFLTSPRTWAPEGEVYILGHEELHNTALEMLTDDEIVAHRTLIYAWADLYCKRAWPSNTPEYLLRGYPQLLHSQADSGGLVKLACDPARHERLWQTTGSDLEALSEIDTAVSLHQTRAGRTGPDIRTSLILAIYRESLHEHSDNVPDDLIITRGLLGHADRAMNLALSCPERERQVNILVTTGHALIRSGSIDDARSFIRLAAEIADKLPTAQSKARSCAKISGAMAEAGLNEDMRLYALKAIDITSVIRNAENRSRILAEISSFLRHPSQEEEAFKVADDAAEMAREITDSFVQARELAEVARAQSMLRQHEEATEIALEARDVARLIADPSMRARALTAIADVMADFDERHAASETMTLAVEAVSAIVNTESRTLVQGEILGSLVRAGKTEQALRIAANFTNKRTSMHALTKVASTLAKEGKHAQAIELARTIADTTLQARTHAEAASALARAGQHAQAIKLARTIADTTLQARTLAEIAKSVALSGNFDQANQIANEAGEIARSSANSEGRMRALIELAQAATESHQSSEAVKLAQRAAGIGRILPDPGRRARALAATADIMAACGDIPQAVLMAREAEEGAYTVAKSKERVRALHAVVRPTVRAHQLARASQIIKDIKDEGWRTLAMGEIAHAYAESGGYKHALKIASAISDGGWQARVLAQIASAMTRAGNDAAAAATVEEALTCASRVTDPGWRARSLSRITETLAESTGQAQVIRIAHEAVETARLVSGPERRAQALAEAANAMASAGQRAQAIQIAYEAMRLPSFKAQARVLSEVAGALARVGEQEQAIKIAKRIDKADSRARALLKIAKESGASPAGRQILAEALQTASWLIACDALPSVAPEAIAVAAKHVFSHVR